MSPLRKRLLLPILVAYFSANSLSAQTLSPGLLQTNASRVGMSAERLARIDAVIRSSIKKKELPGAVVLVARHGRVVWRRAYGGPGDEPQPAPITIGTIFHPPS